MHKRVCYEANQKRPAHANSDAKCRRRGMGAGASTATAIIAALWPAMGVRQCSHIA